MNIIQVENPVFVQTDKPIYKPGQTGMRNQMSKGNFGGEGSHWGLHGGNLCVSVRFRIVSMDVNFHPLNETVSLRVRVVEEIGKQGPLIWKT